MNRKYDLIVVGGGFAGVSAAIAAAKKGVDVLLVERYNCLGGAAANALVMPFMPYWTKDIETKEKKFLCGDIFHEIISEMWGLAGNRNSTDHLTDFDEEILKLVLNRMCKKYGVSLLFNTTVTGVTLDGGSIKSIKAFGRGLFVDLYADHFIDATGDAELSVLAGCACKLGRERDSLCQPMTLCFRMGGVDKEKYVQNRSKITPLYKEYQQKGLIKNPREDILIVRSPIGGMVHINATRAIGVDPTDVEAVSDAEMLLREQMLELCLFFRENVPGGEHCEIASSAVESGIRESRRIVGLVRVTAEDLLSTRKFEDSIARGAYKIDIHNPAGTGTYLKSIPNNDYYTIPYRALIPQNTKNLMVAGRSVSSTHEALAAIRIMPITSCMGEAAGIAASLAIDSACALSEIDVKTLQKKLTENGALY